MNQLVSLALALSCSSWRRKRLRERLEPARLQNNVQTFSVMLPLSLVQESATEMADVLVWRPASLCLCAQDIRLPGGHVDVNLHPTKKEVGFLHAEELVKAICSAVEAKLTSSNTQ